MGTVSLVMADLISNNTRAVQLILPEIKPIKDVNKFVIDSKNFNGNIEKLMDDLAGKEKQCLVVLKDLQEQIKIKMNAMRQLKADLLELQRQLQMPDAKERYNRDTMIQVKFSDETETNVYDVLDALARYSLKMSTLYGDILGLDSDVDYVAYLGGIAKVNKEMVLDWFKREKLFKDKKTMNKIQGSGDSK